MLVLFKPLMVTSMVIFPVDVNVDALNSVIVPSADSLIHTMSGRGFPSAWHVRTTMSGATTESLEGCS